MKKVLLCIFMLISSGLVFGQTFPRDQYIVAGEYFINTDPGEGKATPITGNFGWAEMDVTLDLNIPVGSVVYIRFRNLNTKWSGARAIAYRIPLPYSGAILESAEYFLNTDPGVGNATKIGIGDGGVINLNNIKMNVGDKIYIRVKDSYSRWSATNAVILKSILPNRGGEIVYGEYFLNSDPGQGNATQFTIDASGKIDLQNIKMSKNDNIYFRVNDSYGRWGAATAKKYTYKSIRTAQYYLKIKNSTAKVDTILMSMQTQIDTSWTFTALSDQIIKTWDTCYVRFQSEDYIWGPWYKRLYFPVVFVEANQSFPKEYSLSNPYPNPFNPSVNFNYDLPFSSKVEITIFNTLGQKVKTLFEGVKDAGVYDEVYEPNLASGMYFLRIQANSINSNEHKFISTKKIILLK
jgi:hypothetical protein